ncbi:hypothetical protein CNMCM5623_005139 [Aspergillus felis]|uniref:adenosine deaminase n=1 Tax=Aspergillus felis TaxID=1287682 RepID=A0A8H6VEV0_9EURO|nr:hypothetical protein CNMCM5623_005139 [Aspergillus felis]KAF7184340.1 hypothetical protein CNMCM7691_005092 [Aspergillus felis]
MADPAQLVQAHLRQKAELLESERKLRHDYSFRQSLSELERRACSIVERIRSHELNTIWKCDVEDGSGHLFQGVAFDLAKGMIQRTQLWQIVKRLPKGALLHAHIDGMVDMRWLVETALKTPGIHIKSDRPLTSPDSLRVALIEFKYVPEQSRVETFDIFSPSYIPGTMMPLTRAAETYPYGGHDGLVSHLVSRVTFSLDDCLSHHQGINKIWSRFESIFRILSGLTFYEPIFRQFVHRMCFEALTDKIRWIDLRVVFLAPFQLADGTTGGFLDLLRIFEEELARFQRSEVGSSFWGARIIWTCHRRQNDEFIRRDMENCLAAKARFPDLIAGYDLVGQEGLGRTLEEHLPTLLWFQQECTIRGLDIPFFFHAGEVRGDGDCHDLNILDAVLLGTKRIGHGYSLFQHPLIINEVKSRDICVEVCPISNELLRLNGSVSSHPVPALLANGVAVALSSDTPGVFGHIGTRVSCDFWQILNSFDAVGLEGLGDIAETSILYAAFADSHGCCEEMGQQAGVIRKMRVAEWRDEWLNFCKWIIAQYGEQFSS